MKYLFILLFSLSSFAGEVIFIKGSALHNKIPLLKKAEITYGDIISVGENSMVIIKSDQVVLKLKENTEVKIMKPVNENGQTKFEYYLERGELFFKGHRQKNQKYFVKTKDAIMGVRGTEFFATASEEKNKKIVSWMCVNSGLVAVIIPGTKGEVLVNAGEGVLIENKKLPDVKKYKWTKDLNWNMGDKTKDIKFKDVEDTVDLKSAAYDLEDFNYE